MNKHSAGELYRLLYKRQLWVRCLAGWERASPLYRVPREKIVLLEYPISYRAGNDIVGKLFASSHIMETEDKYWMLGDAVVYPHGDLNDVKN